MPEPDMVCGRLSFLPSAKVRTTWPPGIGMPLGAIRVAPSKYSATRDLPCAQAYRTVFTGAAAWAQETPAARTGSARQQAALQNMIFPFDRKLLRLTWFVYHE